MKSWFRNNGLSAVLVTLFLATFLGGQLVCGWKANNEDRQNHGEPTLALAEYLHSPHFLEATSENWESEFLEIFVYMTLTVFLFQKGSAESNDPDHPKAPRKITRQSPWPVRRGGWWRRLYARSLALTFATLFLVAFSLHASASTKLENEERARLGQPPVTVLHHVCGPKFWFQSFQNWQSEFLAITCMVVFTIFLRQEGSPESKAVEAAHAETGG